MLSIHGTETMMEFELLLIQCGSTTDTIVLLPIYIRIISLMFFDLMIFSTIKQQSHAINVSIRLQNLSN